MDAEHGNSKAQERGICHRLWRKTYRNDRVFKVRLIDFSLSWVTRGLWRLWHWPCSATAHSGVQPALHVSGKPHAGLNFLHALHNYVYVCMCVCRMYVYIHGCTHASTCVCVHVHGHLCSTGNGSLRGPRVSLHGNLTDLRNWSLSLTGSGQHTRCIFVPQSPSDFYFRSEARPSHGPRGSRHHPNFCHRLLMNFAIGLCHCLIK